MEFIARKIKGIYIPEQEDDRVPEHALVKIEYIKKRNYENHKRFFSFVKTTFDMQEHFDDQDVYRKWLTMKAGYFVSCVTPKGETIFLPESIAFEKMDEAEFKQLFSKCINVVLKELGLGMTENELAQVVGYD